MENINSNKESVVADIILNAVESSMDKLDGDNIEKAVFAERTLRIALKRFRGKYFGSVHYALKHKWVFQVAWACIISAITTVVLIRYLL